MLASFLSRFHIENSNFKQDTVTRQRRYFILATDNFLCLLEPVIKAKCITKMDNFVCSCVYQTL
uniref:Uncharacterized protein n=1 Tax=Octopus bimaculoides TaxID=37653 RepID=A0A0L8FT43_OCTBM